MDERKISEILIMLRKEKEVSLDMLCLGLCNKGNYWKYENGKRQPDRLLLNALIQRLGKNPDKLATVLSVEEYAYYGWKKEVLDALGKEDIGTVQSLLEEPEASYTGVNENLQKQFLYHMKAAVAEYIGAPIEEQIDLLKQAVALTMPGMQQGSMKQYLISVSEMEILLKLAERLVKGEQKQEAEELLSGIVEYVEQHYSDEEVRVKIYPHAVKLLTSLLMHQNQIYKGRELCKKAIKMLCRQGVLFHLTELLELYLLCMQDASDTEEVLRYKKQLQALQEVYKEYHAEHYKSDNMWQSYSNQEMYLLDEVVRLGRKNKRMSQEELSADICTTGTLSRIENGKQTPTGGKFRALMKKLDTGLDYENGELDTADFFLLEKKQELNRAISLRNWGEAFELVQYLKNKLDMKNSKNQAVLQANENCILFNEGKMSLEDFLKSCEQAMECEGERWREEEFWQQFFTEYKVSIMNYIACIYKRDNRREDAIFILEHLLKRLKDSKVELDDRYESSMLVVGNLSSSYGEIGKFEECIELCKMDLRISLKCGRGFGIGKALGNLAEAVNDKAVKITENSKRYFEWSYYISELFSVRSTATYADEYYREHYDKNVLWY